MWEDSIELLVLSLILFSRKEQFDFRFCKEPEAAERVRSFFFQEYKQKKRAIAAMEMFS